LCLPTSRKRPFGLRVRMTGLVGHQTNSTSAHKLQCSRSCRIESPPSLPVVAELVPATAILFALHSHLCRDKSGDDSGMCDSKRPNPLRRWDTAKPGSRPRGYFHNEQGWRYNKCRQMMGKILVLAAGVAVALGAVATISGADARHARHIRHHASRGFYGHYGYVPRYHAPRRFFHSPMYAPNAPPPRSYNNPGIPDFQLGSRG